MEPSRVRADAVDAGKIILRGLISPKQYEIGCQLLLITNRKSHMDLDDLEWRNSPYFAFFADFGYFAGQICHNG